MKKFVVEFGVNPNGFVLLTRDVNFLWSAQNTQQQPLILHTAWWINHYGLLYLLWHANNNFLGKIEKGYTIKKYYAMICLKETVVKGTQKMFDVTLKQRNHQ